jgi:pilus assembly protein FimV
VVLCTGLVHLGEAQALALGRIVVQSALGEPLRAEIDVPDINADEAASLRVGLASGEAFRAAGMDFNPALSSLQISLQRRANGTAFLRLTSSRPVNEPFVDMIVEANWASGRIVRDYTLLLDPPNLRAAAPVAPLPAAVATQPAPPVQPPVARPTPPLGPVAPTTQAPPVVRERPTAPPAARPAPAPAPRQEAPGGQVRVRAGDTAGRIAAANRPANVSLDQMLVAMLRANPNAFIAGNVNRIKAGSVIDLPGENDAGTVAPGEARQIIAAQSRDFNEFRRRLAGTVPAASVAAADRQATGRIQTEVEDKKPVAPAQDKLTLSKGATPAQTAAEEKIAQERQAKEAATRVAELSKNIEELAKLGTSTAAVAPTAPATATPSTALPAPALTVPTTAPLATATEVTTSTSTALASATDSVTSTTETAPSAATETAAVTPAVPPVAAPVPMPAPLPDEPSLIDGLRDNPLVLPAAGGLLALLGGFAFYRFRQRKKGNGVDSSFLESRLQPDSFFGSSGGQRIDTAEASASGSSMVYSPSQLDAAGDVDPVAEADVYLAYGRDLQAEEILKEAMRSTPQRVAIHNKLLEIYAKRRDSKAFEVVATEAYGLTQGQGVEWEQACELGRELDPANPLYQPGGAPPVKAGAVAAVMAGGAMNTMPFGSSTLAQNSGPGTGVDNTDLDLDLDFNMDEPSMPASLQAPSDAAMSGMDDLNSTDALTSAADSKSGPPSMSMDFDLDFPSEPAALNAGDRAQTSDAPSLAAEFNPTFDDSEVLPDFALDEPQAFDLPAEDADEPQPLPLTAEASPAEAELLSFDLNDISLDLEDRGGEADGEPGDQLTEENPLDTKLSLAEEFRAIGDLEGARSLAEEVLAEATGALKTKARTFLADLS